MRLMMKKSIIIIFSFTLIVLFTGMCTISFAEFEIDLIASKNNVEINEEFDITVNANNTEIAAFTIWLYFDNEKVDCISSGDDINVIDNRVLYTWISESGTNENLNELVRIKFKAKQEGIASFSIIGEFYNQNGEKIDIKYNQSEIGIGKNYLIEEQNDTEALNDSNEVVSDNNAKLKIMRLNKEGVNPNFNQDINEYYLIVDENTKELDITAIPANEGAEVQIIGNENLKNGLNQIRITVISKDKSNTENYLINITKTNDEEAANANLEMLAVENYTLSPDYQETVTNYAIEVSNETQNLNILAIPTNEKAKVQISGNEDIKIGENQLIITVTATNGITNKKYIINVHRRNEEEEIIHNEEQQNIIEEANQVIEETNNDNNMDNAQETHEENNKEETIENNIIMIIGIVLSIIVMGIVVIRIKKKSK